MRRTIPDHPSVYAVDTANAIFPTVREVLLHGVIPIARRIDETDTGGWFTVWHFAPDEHNEYSPVFGARVGRITGSTTMRELMRVANEKAERLAEHPDHVSSWQTHDVANGKYGGAIRVQRRLIFSFSGLAEHFDEMAMVLAAIKLKLITKEQVNKIIGASDNVPLREYIKTHGIHIPELS